MKVALFFIPIFFLNTVLVTLYYNYCFISTTKL